MGVAVKNRSNLVITVLASAALLSALSINRVAAGAEHFEMTLHVVSENIPALAGKSGDAESKRPAEKVDAFMDTTPPIGGVNPRPVLKLKAGESFKASWHVTDNFPHGIMRAATIHFFVVRQGALGQKPVPDPSGKSGLIDNSLTVDFTEKSTAAGMARLKITEPGFYLVRVQSEDTHNEHDHEHFAAVDLLVR